jgi:NADH-quinone oxidoreductase subunit C
LAPPASHLPAIPHPDGLLARCHALFGARIVDAHEFAGEVTVLVERQAVYEVVRLLKETRDLLFDQMIDICGVDYPERPERFEVVYHLLSMKFNRRIRVKCQTDEVEPVASVVDLFPVAGWFERETWDCFGVYFEGNPDLRRILTDYGFQGHPFRKDFPLSGHVELRYSAEQERVVYEPVQLAQDFRDFDFLSPWEGMLPGDEKAGDLPAAPSP